MIIRKSTIFYTPSLTPGRDGNNLLIEPGKEKRSISDNGFFCFLKKSRVKAFFVKNEFLTCTAIRCNRDRGIYNKIVTTCLRFDMLLQNDAYYDIGGGLSEEDISQIKSIVPPDDIITSDVLGCPETLVTKNHYMLCNIP